MTQAPSFLTTVRLQKEQQKLLKDPIPNCRVRRSKTHPLNFHFYFFGRKGKYAGGYYHGLIQLSPKYPFAPPRVLFYTPSGRFQTNKYLCISFTAYHEEEWSMMWTVETLVIGTISFFEEDSNGIGYMKTTDEEKKKFAKESYAFNLKNQVFTKIFDLQEVEALKAKASLPKVPKAVVVEQKPEETVTEKQENKVVQQDKSTEISRDKDKQEAKDAQSTTTVEVVQQESTETKEDTVTIIQTQALVSVEASESDTTRENRINCREIGVRLAAGLVYLALGLHIFNTMAFF